MLFLAIAGVGTYMAVHALLGVTPATDCTLRRVAAIDIERTSDGQILLPVSVEGHPFKFALDLNSYRSAIFPAAAATFALDIRNGDYIRPEGTEIGTWAVGGHARMYGMPADMSAMEFVSIGGSPQGLFNLKLLPASPFGKNAVDGVIGSDIGEYFDVDLDLKNAKLNLYLSDHCPGKVVYWASEYSSVPLSIDRVDHVTIEMQLDGKPMRTGFSMIFEHGNMSMVTSSSHFGIDGNSPLLKPLVPQPASGPALYTYPFKTLSIEGITINNPQINLFYDTAPECTGKKERVGMNLLQTCYGGSDMTLGLAEMERLHLYFSFAERVLYFTAADAHR